ncbi:MAG: hypothetical protein WD042_11385 [Phycisphaeraceae bacterium]
MGESAANPASVAPTAAPRRRCVVLVRPDHPLPEALLIGLRRRSVDVRVVADVPAVMVELALGGVGIIVVCAPTDLPMLDQMAAALPQYYPGVVCWQAQSDGTQESPRLTKLGTIDSRPPQTRRPPAAAQTVGPTVTPSPPFRPDPPAIGPPAPDSQLTGDPPRPGPRNNGDEPLLTKEELAMLLGAPFEDAQDG